MSKRNDESLANPIGRVASSRIGEPRTTESETERKSARETERERERERKQRSVLYVCTRCSVQRGLRLIKLVRYFTTVTVRVAIPRRAGLSLDRKIYRP